MGATTLATSWVSIRGKRSTMSINRIRARAMTGNTDGTERAFVRLGRMQTRILTGQEDLTTWDEDELSRGRRKDKNGRWVGRDPIVVAKAVHDELVRRTLDKAHQMMVESVVDAVTLLKTIVNNTEVEAKDRLTAAKMILDRTMGREPIRVDVRIKDAWEEALETSVVTLGELGEIIEAESWEADDDDDNDDNPFGD